jgi:hypothetical protein
MGGQEINLTRGEEMQIDCQRICRMSCSSARAQYESRIQDGTQARCSVSSAKGQRCTECGEAYPGGRGAAVQGPSISAFDCASRPISPHSSLLHLALRDQNHHTHLQCKPMQCPRNQQRALYPIRIRRDFTSAARARGLSPGQIISRDTFERVCIHLPVVYLMKRLRSPLIRHTSETLRMPCLFEGFR